MIWVKVCGITNEDDARWAEANGADALGFVFAESPRWISPAVTARIIGTLGPSITPVGVFAGPSPDELAAGLRAGIRIAQIHAPPGWICPDIPTSLPIIRALRVRDPADIEAILTLVPTPWAVLLDTWQEGVEGGTGRTFDWHLAVCARRYEAPIILAGGLADDNVGEAIRLVRPYGVDASSRLESAPGRKDRALVARFIEAARQADALAGGS